MRKGGKFMKYDFFINSFCDSVLTVTRGSYGGKWPMPFFTSVDVGMMIAEYWLDHYLDLINKFKEKKIPIEEITKKIKYPSALTRTVYPNLEIKYGDYPREKIKKKDLFLAEVLYPLYKEDLYCSRYTNILWSKEKIKCNFNPNKIKNLEGMGDKKDILNYNGYLRVISEILFFYFDNLGHETHGPYTLESGEILLIREWHDLNPGYFEFMKSFPFKSFRVYEVYKPGTEIKIDISNRIYINSKMNECLEGFYFETPEKILNIPETKKLIKDIQYHCQKGVEEISLLDSGQILEKAVQMHFYILKPLAIILGVSWKPSEECMKRARQGLTEKDKEPFKVLMRLNLNLDTIRGLFHYNLSLPREFYQ